MGATPRSSPAPGAVGARVGRPRALPARPSLRRRGRPVLAALALALAACTPAGPAEHRLAGGALGTSWSLVLVDDDRSATAAELRALVTGALDEVDRAASTWRGDSELARFAGLARGERMPVSEHLWAVLEAARRVHAASGGAFDPTVAPLVALYGFGAGAADAPPTEAARAAAHARVDFDAVQWTRDPAGAATLGRTREDVTLDLSAIAKGYAVDLVAARLRAAGEGRFLFECGGELVLAGTRISGGPWIVGVNEPLEAPPGQVALPVHARLAVRDRAVATSGDYRQHGVDEEGRRVTHAIDPRTGRAVANEVASVTVVAPSCTLADGLATAVMVLGAEAGLALLEAEPDVEGLLLLHVEGGDPDRFEERATTGFAPLRLADGR